MYNKELIEKFIKKFNENKYLVIVNLNSLKSDILSKIRKDFGYKKIFIKLFKKNFIKILDKKIILYKNLNLFIFNKNLFEIIKIFRIRKLIKLCNFTFFYNKKKIEFKNFSKEIVLYKSKIHIFYESLFFLKKIIFNIYKILNENKKNI
ncbi:hypothetical protein [Candidatus Vidania fulgoroideorum]